MLYLYYYYSTYSYGKRIVAYISIPFLSWTSPIVELIGNVLYNIIGEESESENSSSNSSRRSFKFTEEPSLEDFGLDQFKVDSFVRFKNRAKFFHDIVFFIPSTIVTLLLFKIGLFENPILIIFTVLLIWATFVYILDLIYEKFYGNSSFENFLAQLTDSREYWVSISQGIIDYRMSEYRYQKEKLDAIRSKKVLILDSSMRSNLIKEFNDLDNEGDWVNRQKANLKLIWLETSKKNIISIHNPQEIPYNEFQFKWNLGDVFSYLFAEEILNKFGEVLENNFEKKLYRDESELPVPRIYIKKAIYFSLDFISTESNLIKIPNIENRKLAIKVANMSLDNFFISNSKSQDIGNLRAKEFDYDTNYYQYIEWWNEDKWLLEASTYSVHGNDKLVISIIDTALKYYPKSKSLTALLGITYLNMAEAKLEIDESELAILDFTKSAKLGNEEAINWLIENKFKV